MTDFGKVKEPCWIVLDCSKYIHPNCPAYQHQEKSCWEYASTECKKLLGIKWECKDCRVFKLYNKSQGLSLHAEKRALLLDAGDLLFKNFSAPYPQNQLKMLTEKARLIVESFNLMGYDAIGYI